MKIAVYPGSFDPVTNGHLDVIKRSAKVFDKVIVGVLDNMAKKPLFTPDERVDMIKKVASDIENVEVYAFSGLLVDFMKQFDSAVIIKGLRTISDFEYEFQMALLNKSLNPDVETFFMMTDSKYSYISSSMVKEVARLGGGIDEFVPCDIIKEIDKKIKNGGHR
ncbi:MAG: pantetheine-phosphate adenylyltransferase [Ruminococcaceae bacterium]|nr:pantetheine-phosphate adenylyltransferase [Oscillospiraceae bacterium]